MVIAVIGKGGVGKTTLSALLLRRLVEGKCSPVLAVDADPSSCLGPVLGLAPERTLGDLRDEMRDDSRRPPGISKGEWFAIKAEEAMVEEEGFDLLTMGHPEGPGCYCFVNNLLRDHLSRLSRSYRHVLVDCEAGQEHLSRRTTQRPEVMVAVVSPSRMAAETVRRSLALYEGLHESLPRRVDLVLNGFEEGDPLVEELAAVAAGGGCTFTGTYIVPRDRAVTAHEASGRSLLELDRNTPALTALEGWEEDL